MTQQEIAHDIVISLLPKVVADNEIGLYEICYEDNAYNATGVVALYNKMMQDTLRALNETK